MGIMERRVNQDKDIQSKNNPRNNPECLTTLT